MFKTRRSPVTGFGQVSAISHNFFFKEHLTLSTIRPRYCCPPRLPGRLENKRVRPKTLLDHYYLLIFFHFRLPCINRRVEWNLPLNFKTQKYQLPHRQPL